MFSKVDVRLGRGVLTAALAGAVVLSLPAAARAQAIVDARRVEFNPSADHDVVLRGMALVTSYELQIFAAGGSQIVRSVNLGKPSPQSDGLIRLDFVALLSPPLAPGQSYEARVAALGPGGVGRSALSNRFSFTPTCAPTLSATSASLPAAAATGSVSVTAPTGCAWSASSPAGWLTVTSGASRTGSGTVTFGATANTTTAARSATMTIASRTFTVTQAGAAGCAYTISPSSRASGAAGETTTVSVTAGSSCAWTAVSETTWLTVTSGARGVGNGSARIVVAANTSTALRRGTVRIAGRTFTVNQSGTSCAYTVTPGTLSAGARGRTGTISVKTAAGCAWSATGVPAWITVPSGARTGPGTLAYTVAPNTSAARNARLRVAGRAVAVSQAAGAPTAPANVRVVTRRPGSR